MGSDRKSDLEPSLHQNNSKIVGYVGEYIKENGQADRRTGRLKSIRQVILNY